MPTAKPCTYTINASPADAQRGTIDGYELRCSCGEVASFSSLLMTQAHGRDHAAYMARKAAQPRRRVRAEYRRAGGAA